MNRYEVNKPFSHLVSISHVYNAETPHGILGVQTFDGNLAHCRGVMGQVHARQAQAMRPNEGPAEDDGDDDAFLLSSVRAKVMAVNVEGLGRTKDDIVMNSVQDLFKVKWS